MKKDNGITIYLILAASLYSASAECVDPVPGLDSHHYHIETPTYPIIQISSKIVSGVTASGLYNSSLSDVGSKF
jgi:hypothetical protein